MEGSISIELDTLPLTNTKEIALTNLSFEYSRAFRICFGAIKQFHPKTSTELHHLTYKIVREKTNLPSQLVEQARRFAWNNRRNGVPKNIPIVFDTRLFKSTQTERGNPVILLRAIEKRIAIPIKQNRNYQRFQDLLRNGWHFKSFLLVENKIKAVLQKNFEVSKGETVVGIDVGSASLATATVFDPVKNKVLKQLYFGRDVKHKRILFELRRAKLQSKNNCRARSRLRKIRRAERNFVKTRIFQVANKIVKLARQYKSSIAIENIKGLRVRKRKMRKKSTRIINKIPYRKFFFALKNIATRNGIKVIKVNPRNTSKTCFKCGAIDKRNRHNSTFKCISCGFTANSDRVASHNIALLGVRAIAQNTPSGWR